MDNRATLRMVIFDILKDFKFLDFNPKTLEDLVLLGIAFRDVSGSVFVDLMEEIKKVTSVPVLVAVDQYNSWEAKSAFAYEDLDINGRDICVPSSLKFISKKKVEMNNYKLANGLCVAATSFKNTEGKKVTYDDVQNTLPLLVKVPNYNQIEFLSAISHYVNQSIVSNDISLNELLAFRMLSASNPRQVRKELVPFFFSKLVAKNTSSLSFSSEENLNVQNVENSLEPGGYEVTNVKEESTSSLVDSFIDKKNDKVNNKSNYKKK